MITWLASYPRSGNTMFRLALKYLCNVDTWSVYGDRDIVDMGAAVTVGHLGQIREQRVMDVVNEPHMSFVKTHGRPDPSDESPVIHIVRDGRDALVSYAHYMIKINGDDRPFIEILQDLVVGRYSRLWGGWSGHAAYWMDRPVPTALVRYEDMLQDVRGVLRMALDIVGYDTDVGPEELMPQFSSLNRKWPNFFRSGGPGSWESQMPGQLCDKFWNDHGPMMERLGYKR